MNALLIIAAVALVQGGEVTQVRPELPTRWESPDRRTSNYDKATHLHNTDGNWYTGVPDVRLEWLKFDGTSVVEISEPEKQALREAWAAANQKSATQMVFETGLASALQSALGLTPPYPPGSIEGYLLQAEATVTDQVVINQLQSITLKLYRYMDLFGEEALYAATFGAQPTAGDAP